MINQIGNTKYTGIEIRIARLYLYLLPIRMFSQLGFLRGIFGGAAINIDFVLHALAIVLMMLRTRGTVHLGTDRSSQLMQHFAKLILFLNLSSLLMACVIQIIHGDYAGESAFSGIIGMMIYFTQYAFMLFYNKYIFNMLSKDEVLKILRRVCWFLLGLGYLQIAALNFGGFFVTIHDSLDIFDVLYDAARMPKLTLTGSEGAAAGSLISVLVMPILYGSILFGSKIKTSIVQVILWLPVLLFTNSSTAYILFAVVTAFFFALYIKKSKKTVLLVIFIFLCVIFLATFLLPDLAISILPDEMAASVRYLLLEKIVDRENGSTVSRTVPLIVNWGAFTEYPLLGVGNGLQGYFYVDYFPEWAFSVTGSDVGAFLDISRTGISNGGVFFPSLLSGYGIVGIFAIVLFVIHLSKHAKWGKGQMGEFYYVFLIASLAILVTGFQGDFYGKYYLWFMLSLPLMAKG